VRLAQLSHQARQLAEAGEVASEAKVLEQMLALLPEGIAQAQAIRDRLAEIGRDKPQRSRPLGKLAALGALGLLIWKFKALIVVALTKGKMLLLGLTKTKTLFTMALSLSLYWTVWGWQFALGFVLSIYVHEMGHVVALRRMGIPASSPMFIPFVGAFVRLRHAPRTAHEDAVVGLAGPIYGLGAAVGCYVLFALTDISLLGRRGPRIQRVDSTPAVAHDRTHRRRMDHLARGNAPLAPSGLRLPPFCQARCTRP
jgi:hypothetical protein